MLRLYLFIYVYTGIQDISRRLSRSQDDPHVRVAQFKSSLQVAIYSFRVLCYSTSHPSSNVTEAN